MEQLRVLGDLIARWALLALFALLPLFFIPGGNVSVAQSKLGVATFFICIAAIGWFAARLSEGTARLPKHVVLFASTLLPVAYIFSALIAGWSTSSIFSGLADQDTVAVSLLWFASLALAAGVFGAEARAYIAPIRALLIGSGVLMVLQVVRLLFPDATTFGLFSNQTVTAVGSWHDLGIIIGLVVLLSGALLSTRYAATGTWRLISQGLWVAGVLFLVVISMNDIWFTLAAAWLLSFVYWTIWGGGTDMMTNLKKALPWFGFALAGFLLGWFNTQIHAALPTALQVVAIEVRPSWEGTFAVSEGIADNSAALLFGSGPNSFSRNWALYKPDNVNTTLFWNLDFNTGVGAVPTTFVTIGVLGVLAWGILAAAFLLGFGYALKNAENLATSRIIFAIGLAVVFLFAFQVLYVPGLAISMLLFLFMGLFIAVPLMESHRSSLNLHVGFSSTKALSQGAFVIVPVLLLVVVSGFSVRALASDIYVNKSIITYRETGNAGASSALVTRALSIWPDNDRAHRAAVELGILELAQIAQSGQTEEVRVRLQGTLSQTIEHGLRAVAIDDADHQNWLTLAQLYQELAGVGIEGAYEQAQRAYQEARNDNPKNPLPLLRLAQLEVIRNNQPEALKHLDAAIALKPDFAAAHFTRSQLLAQTGDLQNAIQSGLIAVQLVPQDPIGWYSLGTILYAARAWNDAITSFAQAATLRPDYSNAIFMLGLSLYTTGNTEQAVAALARVQELNPEDRTVPGVIANMRAGREPFAGLTR